MFSLWHKCTCGKCICNTQAIFCTEQENGRKLTIKNKDGSHICIIKLDGCAYPNGNSESKCDYIFTIESADGKQKKILLVELKGGNVDDAYDQIEKTIGLCKKQINGFKKEAIIVAKKCPRADDTKAKKKKDLFATKYSTKLMMKTDKCVIDHSFA
ncbi:hypothetical protein M5F03_02430 [Acinetobacter sp. ANC 5579]|uniref:hypothetical protein n=1 Tax=Acinetobacter amyesii TaxID=2942470 RepID=UPI0020BE3D0A|nr:hypothetical protein [Acinetobacter amyesii]MCL6234034.1 hypothetical protein [Acinetobacter amyesii]